MGIDLRTVTQLVLSHGHDDHTRGLRFLKERFDVPAPLIAHPYCFSPRWVDDTYIGPPYTTDIEEQFGCYLVYDPIWLTENCVFLGEIPVYHDFEPRYAIGEVEIDGERRPDYLLDDTALVCRTEQGLFIITGCSHSGICNIVTHARAVCGEERIAGIIGGFHLLQRSPRVDATVEFLKTLGPDCRLYPCHCVSLHAKARMAQSLEIGEIGVGSVIEA